MRHEAIGGTIAQIIGAHARHSPGSTAIMSRARPPLSYLRLATEIERFPDLLNRFGIGRGDRVALLISTRAEALVAFLCISNAATAVPLDPDGTDQELRSALIQTKAAAVVVSDDLMRLQPIARNLGLLLLTLTPDNHGAAGTFQLTGASVRIVSPSGAAQPSDIAIIQLTSGTTSKPKAIPLSHALMTRRGACEVMNLALSERDVCANFRPTHLASALNIGLMASMTTGGSVVLPDCFNADAFFHDLRDFGVTWYTGGPAYHEAILERAPFHREILEQSTLRFIRSSSYSLSHDLLQRLEATFGVICVEKYGCGEAGTIACNPLDAQRRKPGTVGMPFQCDVQILDPQGAPQSPGHEGEIVVRGPHVFRGYDDDDEATASALIDGWYRTGDLGTFDEDGYLIVSGRLREIINCGGKKISPSEVEAALNSHDNVVDSICMPIPHKTLGHVAGAAVVLRDGAEFDEVVFRDYIRHRLADFKVPRIIVSCHTVPRGADGKLLRRRAGHILGLVQTPQQDGSIQAKAPRPKRSALSTSLAALWCRVLQLESIGDDDNFVLSGGDSLRAMRLMADIYEVFQVRLPLTLIYGEGATLAGMTQAILAERTSMTSSLTPPETLESHRSSQVRDPSSPCLLSFSQKRLWFLSKADPSGSLYNTLSARRFIGHIDVEVLRNAINVVVARQSALRTHISMIDGEPHQYCAPDLQLDVPAIDLSSTPEDQRADEISRLTRSLLTEPFSLEHGPLIRCLFIRISASESLLLVTTHHIIWDARSAHLFFDEALEFYHEFSGRKVAQLPPLPVHFGDHVVAQRNRLQGSRLRDLSAYWRHHLEGAPTVIELPTDRRRPAVQTSRGTRLNSRFEPQLVEQVRSVAAARQTSLFVVGLAAFALLIHRLTGQEDFIIGTGIDDRTPGETDSLIGFFINTLPLRLRMTQSDAFLDLLSSVRSVVLGAIRHRDMPFEQIVEDINPSRSESWHPLVQVLFGAMPQTSQAADACGPKMEPCDTEPGSSRFDLSMMISEERGALHVITQYSSDLFDRETVVQLVAIYKQILEEIVRDADRPLRDFSLISDRVKDDIISRWSGASTPYPSASSIHELFSSVAHDRPDAVAISCNDVRVTYGELDHWSDRLSHQLRCTGIGPDAVVAITSERSPSLVAGLLAILKAGAGYLAIDATLPRRRLDFMLEDAGVAVVLAQDGSAFSTEAKSIQVIGLAADMKGLADQSVELEPVICRPERLAYVVYTSGSTGQPKGVCIPHRAVVRLVMDIDYADLGPTETILQFAPVPFDASTFEIWGSLLNGGTLVLAPPHTLSQSELAHLIESAGITTLWLTAGLFHQMTEYEIGCFRNVRQLLAGGDVLSVDHVRRFIQAHPNCRLINGYGPSENTTFTCAYTVTNAEMLEPSVPIGRPISNTRVYILDEQRNPVPFGIAGELYAGGDGVALGYLNQAELTAERFLPDPFDFRAGARMYKTGDRVRFLANGDIQFLGRIDDQVKIRGFRVEPREVEIALLEHTGIRQASVLAHQDSSDSNCLMAYVIAEDRETALTSRDVRKFLAGRLPHYMLPAQIIFVPSIPLTSNGKVDRARLLEIDWRDPDEKSRVLPRTPVEQILGAIWQEILGVTTVGIDENFFEMGGHSLLAMRMIFRISEELREDVPVTIVFRKPTIRSLALEITRRMMAEGEAFADIGAGLP